MFNTTPRTYKSNPRDLLQFISMLDLWDYPRFSKDKQEIVVATSTWTGVRQTPRPMATLYLAENLGHQPLTGTIVLIDNTPGDAPPGTLVIDLEGRPYRDFNPNAMWAPIIEKRYDTPDYKAIAPELHEIITTHWSNNWFTSVAPEDR